MERHWFYPPVSVLTGKIGRAYAVTSVEKAAEFLLAWRNLDERGSAWEEAATACMRAIDGSGSPEEARTAFEAAARECRKLL